MQEHLEIVALMKQLIEIESPYYHEQEIMKFTVQWLKDHGFSPEVHRYQEKKPMVFEGENVICSYEGEAGGPTICLNAHLDTVPLCTGWTRDPFAGEVDGDRIYGLGALDMKSGACANLLALKRFRENHPTFKGRVLLTLVSDEEGPFGLGTNALIEDGFLDDVDCSVVTEPSGGFCGNQFPVICLGARGAFVYEVEFFGTTAHASTPENGHNAAVEAAKFIQEMDRLQLEPKGVLGKGSCCILKMEADGGACSVPEYAKVTIHRHVVIGESEEDVYAEAEAAIQRAGIQCRYQMGVRPYPTEGSKYYMPYVISEEDPYAQLMMAAVREACGTEPKISYLSSIGDFNYLGTRLGAPSMIFGATGGSIHGADEYADLSSIAATADVIYQFLAKTLAV